MNAGTYISLALHVGIFGAALFGMEFEVEPSERPVTDVSIISSIDYDILTQNVQPNLPLAPDALLPTSKIPDSLPFLPPTPEMSPRPRLKPLVTQLDLEPKVIPEAPLPPKPVENTPSLPPVIEEAEVVSKPEEPIQETVVTENLASEQVAPPPPEAAVSEEVTQAASPSDEPAVVETEAEEAAPEAAATDFVAETDDILENLPSRTSAPETSSRPKMRSRSKRVVEVADEIPLNETDLIPPVPVVDNGVEVALEQLALELALDVALLPAMSDSEVADPVSTTQQANDGGEMDQSGIVQAIIQTTVDPCLSKHAVSESAAGRATTVFVSLVFNKGGYLRSNGIGLDGFEGGIEEDANTSFKAIRAAILECGGKGFDLPTESHALWENVVIRFLPESK